jgi:Bcr/CflA subfamily drug resistance transporter
MKQKTKLLTLVILFITLGQLSPNIYLSSMPEMSYAYGVTYNLMEFTITIAMITFGIALFVYGPLSDHFGRKKIALTGISIFILGTILCILSNNIRLLILGRALQGLGIGCSGAIAPAIIRDSFLGKKHFVAFSYFSIALVLTPIIAVAIGGYLQQYISWRATSYFLLIFGIVLLVLFAKFLPETNKRLREFSLHPKKIFKRYLAILFDLHFVGALVCLVLIFSGQVAYLITSPYIFEKMGLSPILYGWVVILSIFGFLLGSLILSFLNEKIRIKKLIFTGLLIAFFASCVMSFLSFFDFFHIWRVVIPMFVYMIGSGLVLPNCLERALEKFPRKAGMASALIIGFQVGGAGLISIIIEKMPLNSPMPLSFLLLGLSFLSIIAYFILIRPFKDLQNYGSNS